VAAIQRFGLPALVAWPGAKPSPKPSAVPSARALPNKASPPAPSSSAQAAPRPTSSQTAAKDAEPPASGDGIKETQRDAPTCAALLQGPEAQDLIKGPSAEWQMLRASHFVRTRKPDDALRIYCRALVDYPQSSPLRVAFLELLFHQRDNRVAMRYTREFLEAFPKESQFKWMLGDAQARDGDWAAARATWLEAAVAGPTGEHERVRFLARQALNAARGAVRPGRFDQAERTFRRAAILDPEDVEAATGLAQMLLQNEDPKSAAAWARRAIKRAPKYATMHVVLGNALRAAGDAEGAEASWREALRLDAGNEEAAARLRSAGKPR
jgi:tetratricopeptide (TPR) repeat protein